MTPDQLKYKQTNQPIASKWNQMKQTDDTRKRIGGGGYADAYASEKDPGGIDKVAKPSEITSLAADAYYQFLDMIAHNERIAKNPFFPRVYKLETFRDKAGKYTYNVNMEKLAGLSSLSTEEATRIGRELFTDFDTVVKQQKKEFRLPKTRPTGDANDTENRTKMSHLTAVMGLADCFNEALFSSTPPTNITNSHLRQAITLLRKILASNSKFSPDLHHGNLMVRRGPFAPQIVITDPISGGDTSAPESY